MEKNDLRFGQRYANDLITLPIQLYSLNELTRIELWNAVYYHLFQACQDTFGDYGYPAQRCHRKIWNHILKKPADELKGSIMLKDAIKPLFLMGKSWTKPYEFIEGLYTLNILYDLDLEDEFATAVNKVLQENFSGYTLINGCFIPVTTEFEIEEIGALSENLRNGSLDNVRKHLDTAIGLLSQKENTPYNKVIHAAISMVEATALTIESKAKSLNEALQKLKTGPFELHPALEGAFNKLYAYTSDADGIRHAHKIDETSNLGVEDARFFLVACSAFCNYLLVKSGKVKS